MTTHYITHQQNLIREVHSLEAFELRFMDFLMDTAIFNMTEGDTVEFEGITITKLQIMQLQDKIAPRPEISAIKSL